jgi:Tol biopolymer transport system component
LSAESGKERLFASAITGGLGFSPDSRRLMLGHNEPDAAGLVHVKWLAYPVAGGAPTDSLVLSGRSTDAQWNMDGRGVIYVDAGDPARNLYRQDFGASAPVPITRYTEGRITEFAPAPDAKHLAIVRRIGPAENVWVADPDGNHPVQVTQFTSERVFELCWLSDGRRLAIGAGSASRDAVLIRKFR